MSDIDSGGSCSKVCAPQHLLQLSNVTWPVFSLEVFARSLTHLTIGCQKIPTKRADALWMLTQRRNRDDEASETEIEILSEGSRHDQCAEVLM